MFKAAAAKVLVRQDDDTPKPRRKSGDTEKGFGMVWRLVLRRTATRATQARPTAVYSRATLYLADTLDWLNLWQDNADIDHGIANEFGAKEDQSFPQPQP